MNKVKTYVEQYKPVFVALIAILVGVFVVLGIHSCKTKKLEKPVIVTNNDVKDTKKFSNAINVPVITAQDIQDQIANKPQPVTTYYESAPTVQQASVQTAKAIEQKDERLPAVAVAKSDRTAVVANEEEQKVDVYKINLNKAHKIKAGATLVDNKSYGTVGYQAGRFEGLAHFDNKGFQGGTMLYTVYEW